MKAYTKIILPAIILGLLCWVIDAFIDSMFFYESLSMGDFLFFPASVHEIYARLIVIMVFLASGIIVSWLLVKCNQVEDKIILAYQELNQIINSSVDGICVIDKDSKILRVNKIFLALFDVSEDEALGKRCHEVYKCFKCYTSSCPLARILNGEEHIECEIEKEQKNGIKIPLILSAVPFRRTGGELIGIVVNFRNITERKQLENQLIHAQKMESIGRLAGSIAHDFNNLLTLIIGNAEYVLMSIQHDEPIYESINMIKNTADRCVNLTRQLLTLSHQQHIESCSIILKDMLEDMVNMFRRLIGKDIKIEILTAEDIWRVKAKPGQIEQVLMNLVVNARDAMPDGGKITIETANVTFGYDYVQNHTDIEPGDYVMIAVSDTGVGMSEETMSHIFEPFFTTKEKGKGTGLGLSTCYGIVKQNGGNIRVYSEKGHGTTFKMYFPREKDESSSLSLNEDFNKLPEGTETVVVAENNSTLRQLAAYTLREKGYTVIEAQNSKEALKKCEKKKYSNIHLIIADAVMLQMGGKVLYNKLRGIYPSIKVLLMSGLSENAIVHHGFQKSGIGLLQKPFISAELVRKVRQVLDE